MTPTPKGLKAAAEKNHLKAQEKALQGQTDLAGKILQKYFSSRHPISHTTLPTAAPPPRPPHLLTKQ